MAHWARQMAGRIPRPQKPLDISHYDVLTFLGIGFLGNALKAVSSGLVPSAVRNALSSLLPEGSPPGPIDRLGLLDSQMTPI